MTESDTVARIEIQSEHPAIGVSAAVLHEIRNHALEAAPEECCGLVFGAAADATDAANGDAARFERVYRCSNVMDRMHRDDPESFPRTNHDAFYIDPGELQRAEAEAGEAGQAVTAVYHSHVSAGAYFSEMDQALATDAFPEADQIVVSLLDGHVHEVGFFRRDGAGTLCGFRVESIPS